jgi:hypothetical protein
VWIPAEEHRHNEEAGTLSYIDFRDNFVYGKALPSAIQDYTKLQV